MDRVLTILPCHRHTLSVHNNFVFLLNCHKYDYKVIFLKPRTVYQFNFKITEFSPLEFYETWMLMWNPKSWSHYAMKLFVPAFCEIVGSLLSTLIIWLYCWCAISNNMFELALKVAYLYDNIQMVFIPLKTYWNVENATFYSKNRKYMNFKQ